MTRRITTDPLVELTIPPDYVERLCYLAGGVQGREAVSDPQSGSNGSDDGMTSALQDGVGDLSRLEVGKEIEGLNERQRDELVALFWVGRGDFEPQDWEMAVAAAAERRELPAGEYLLGQPLVGSLWLEGLSRLGIGSSAISQHP